MSSRDIPDAIKRKVRQQCGFGCVICGVPVFHYDHIDDFASVQAHEVDNLALLCEMHHGAKTTGKLSRERVAEARLAPFNLSRKQTSGYRLEQSRKVNIACGRNKITAVFRRDGAINIISMYGEDYFVLHSEGDWLSISARLTDKDGNIILSVDRGEICVSTGVWDYRYEGSRLQIHEGKRRIILDMELSDQDFTLNKALMLNERRFGFEVDRGILYGYTAGLRGSSIGGSEVSVESGMGVFQLAEPPKSRFQPPDRFAITVYQPQSK